MRHHTIRTRSVALAVSSAALVLAAAGPALAQDEPLITENPRPNSGPLTGGDAAYEYAPAVIAENGVYRMWYCAQDPQGTVPGDVHVPPRFPPRWMTTWTSCGDGEIRFTCAVAGSLVGDVTVARRL